MYQLQQLQLNLFSLPNEVLLNILNPLPTAALLAISPTCKQLHSLVLRIMHQRLQIAANLAGHTLYLECHHPSARLTAAKLFCSSLGTPGLQDLLADIYDESTHVGQGRRIRDLYSRFRPQRNEPDYTPQPPMRRAGDIPGSRTYPTSQPIRPDLLDDDDDVARENVTVDAHDLFSQLSTLSYLGKREKSRGLLFTIQEVSEGTIRVWREWLSRQCESKSWTDGEVVTIHQDKHNHGTNHTGDDIPETSPTSTHYDPKRDSNILWTNTRDDNVGIRFRVKARKMRPNTPVMYASDLEVPVTYEVEYEEIIVRTSHLILKLEEAERQLENNTGKAIMFGSFFDQDVREINTGGGHVRW